MLTVKQTCLYRHADISSMRRCFGADVERFLNRSSEDMPGQHDFKRLVSAFFRPELLCLFTYRLAHFLHLNGWKRIATFLSGLNFVLHKVCIPASSCIGPGCRLSHPAGVIFHGNAGDNFTLFGMAVCIETEGDKSSSLIIGNDVTIGAHAVILGCYRIGDAVKIGPFSSVRSDINDGATVVSVSMRTSIEKKVETIWDITKEQDT